jgi:peptidoglycan-associated lipoprotein
MRTPISSTFIAALLVAATVAGCSKKQPPVAVTPPPSTTTTVPATPDPVPPPPPTPVPVPPPIVPDEPVVSDPLAGMTPDEINREAPLAPVFFGLDSDVVDADGQQVLQKNAEVLKKYSTWAITIEGHSDERGTAEYNLALGERRAMAVKVYLVSLGIAADRIRTVSYGKEFPFDPGHDEAAWKNNRRGHFVVTGK